MFKTLSFCFRLLLALEDRIYSGVCMMLLLSAVIIAERENE